MGHATVIGFHGPRLYGLRARLAENDDERHQWLNWGEDLLQEGANARNSHGFIEMQSTPVSRQKR
ncbi:MAG: hypothetical protein VCB63_12905 [Alphaproteobacteria bacterium]